MKRLFFLMVWISAVCGGVYGQVTLDECLEAARNHYPLIQERDLIREVEQYDLKRIGKGWLPQLNVSAKAQYQSEVVEMSFEIPGYEFDLPHDQYSVVGELNQTVWDGGSNASQKSKVRAEAEVQHRQLDVSLYAIRQQVQNLFLGVLLMDKQIAQNEIVIKSLNRSLEEARVGLEQGVSYQSDVDQIRVRILDYQQKKDALCADRKTYVAMLGKLTGKDLDGAQFSEPEVTVETDSMRLARPEMGLYQAQLRQTEVQRKELQTYLYPKLNLSFQGGLGRPGLNMLKNEFEPYYTVGLKLQWNIGALYSRKEDLRKVKAQERRVKIEQETFVFNTMLEATEQMNAVDKAERIWKQDREIIRLRESLRQAGEEQYRQGVIRMTELMDRIDDEFDARVAESIHQVQFIMAVYDLRNTLGQ